MADLPSLSREEQQTVAQHVESYAATRSTILSAWSSQPTQYLTLESCRALVPDSTSDDALKQAYDFLQQHGMINFGAVCPSAGAAPDADVSQQPPQEEEQAPPPAPAVSSLQHIKKKLYELLRTVDFEVVTEKQIRLQLGKELGIDLKEHKDFIRKHVEYMVGHMEEQQTVEPLEDDDEDDDDGAEAEADKKAGGKDKASKRVVVIGAGAAGLAAASTLKKAGAEVLVLESSSGLPTLPAELLMVLPEEGQPLRLLALQSGLEFSAGAAAGAAADGAPEAAGAPLLLMHDGSVAPLDAAAEAQSLLRDLLSSLHAEPGPGGRKPQGGSLGALLQAELEVRLRPVAAPGAEAKEGAEAATAAGADKPEAGSRAEGEQGEGEAGAGKVEDGGAEGGLPDGAGEDGGAAPASSARAAPSSAALELLGWYLRSLELQAGAPLSKLHPAAAAADAANAERAATPWPRQPWLLRAARPADADGNGDGGGDGGLAPAALSAHSKLLQGLSAGLDIRYGCAVEHIAYNKKGVKLTTASGEKLDAALVIVALPLHRLRRPHRADGDDDDDDDEPGGVTFAPALPSWKTGALSRLSGGAGACVLLRYETPFWEASRAGPAAGGAEAAPELFGLVAAGGSREAAAVVCPWSEPEAAAFAPVLVTGLRRALGLPALAVHFAGDLESEGATDEALTSAATEAVRTMFASAPDAAPAPAELHVMRWGTPGADSAAAATAGCGFSCGTSSGGAEDVRAARAPVGNRLCFAGEFTADAVPYGGHLAAALCSGVREASRALRALLPRGADGRGKDAAPRLGAVGEEEELDVAALEAHEEAAQQQQEEGGEGEAMEEEGGEGEQEEEEEEEERGKAAQRKKKGKRSRQADDVGEEEEDTSKKAKKRGGGRGAAAAAAVAAMDRPGGLGDYDPKRAALELIKRQEARQDIKLAHKAMIQAGSGNLNPLWEVLNACNHWDGKQQLVHVLVQASTDALEAIAVDGAILKIVNDWLDECSTMGASMEHLVKEILRLLGRLPSRPEVLKSCGIPVTVRQRCLEQCRSKDVRKQAEELLGSWSRKLAPGGAARRPTPPAGGRAGAGPAPPKPAAAPAAPAPHSAIVASHVNAAYAMIDTLAQENKLSAARSQLTASNVSLPTISTFDEYRKQESRSRPPPGPKADGDKDRDKRKEDAGKAAGSTAAGAGAAGGGAAAGGAAGAGAGAGASTDAQGKSVVEDYVKRQLHPHVKSGAITKEVYSAIKEKTVKKVMDAHGGGGGITADFLSDDKRKKIKGMVESYLTKYKVAVPAKP